MTYDEIIEQLEITKNKIKEIARNEYGGESWKNLKEFIQCGRDPAYLKNGDIITEELAWEVVGQEGYADGYDRTLPVP